MQEKDFELMIDTLQLMLKHQLGKDLPREEAKNLYGFAGLLVDIALGEFKCQSCGGKFRIYAVNLADKK